MISFFLSLAQVNSSVLDFRGNLESVLKVINQSKEEGKHLFLFPEGMLTGYPLGDWLEQDFWVDSVKMSAKRIQKNLNKNQLVIVGAYWPLKGVRPWRGQNVALVIDQKKINVIPKTLLPNQDVFYEKRWLFPGTFQNNFLIWNKIRLFVTICEDIWSWRYDQNPLSKIKVPVDLVINISASPYTSSKKRERLQVISKTASHFKAPVVYCNRVGVEDEIIFDGSSFIYDRGRVVWNGGHCREQVGTLLVTRSVNGQKWYFKPLSKSLDEEKLPSQSSYFAFEPRSTEEKNEQRKKLLGSHRGENVYHWFELREALVFGIKDFAQKNGFSHVHLGLSGGVDSALVYALACQALGPHRVDAIWMGTEFNSEESLLLSQELTQKMGARLLSTDIQALFEEIQDWLRRYYDLQGFGLVQENVQSRLRGMLLMAYANMHRSLLLSTSNKSEIFTGYSTLYGDMCGGLAPIGDLWKTEVYELAKIYVQEGVLPKRLLTRPPSAELRHNQKDQDTLPPYPELDQLGRVLVDCQKGPDISWEKISQNPAWDLFLRSEFKRWQSPPILKVSSRAFGRGRLYPVTKKPTLLR